MTVAGVLLTVHAANESTFLPAAPIRFIRSPLPPPESRFHANRATGVPPTRHINRLFPSLYIYVAPSGIRVTAFYDDYDPRIENFPEIGEEYFHRISL